MSSRNGDLSDREVWDDLGALRKVLYGLGATVIGASLSSIPTSLVVAGLSVADEAVARPVSLLVATVFLVGGSVVVFRWMRRDYEYVHSAAYGRRNPVVARHR